MTAESLLLIVAPEFTGVDASGAISVAEMQIADGLCGDKRPLLVAYLAAHILTMSKRGGDVGAVTGLKEGQLSINYGSTGTTGSLGQTGYGAEYDRLSRACVFAARTRVCR